MQTPLKATSYTQLLKNVMKKEENQNTSTPIGGETVEQFLVYCEPFLERACEGGFSGHNFNSYLPKHLKDGIPVHFRDMISTVISSIAKKSAQTSTNRITGRVTANHMPLRYFDWMKDRNLKTIPSGFETYYYPWMLYEAFKCLEIFLNLKNEINNG